MKDLLYSSLWALLVEGAFLSVTFSLLPRFVAEGCGRRQTEHSLLFKSGMTVISTKTWRKVLPTIVPGGGRRGNFHSLHACLLDGDGGVESEIFWQGGCVHSFSRLCCFYLRVRVVIKQKCFSYSDRLCWNLEEHMWEREMYHEIWVWPAWNPVGSHWMWPLGHFFPLSPSVCLADIQSTSVPSKAHLDWGSHSNSHLGSWLMNSGKSCLIIPVKLNFLDISELTWSTDNEQLHNIIYQTDLNCGNAKPSALMSTSCCWFWSDNALITSHWIKCISRFIITYHHHLQAQMEWYV